MFLANSKTATRSGGNTVRSGNCITYTIRRHDTLYTLAKEYQTTVDSILKSNPGIDPYNLRIGSNILICPQGNGGSGGSGACFSYTVVGDETFYLIAKKFGISVDSILASNPNIDPYNLKDGDVILVCGNPNLPEHPNTCQNGITYIIRKGDTLYRIAAFYQTTVDSIIAANPGIQPNNLKIGSTITVCVGDSFFTPPITYPRPPIGTIPPEGGITPPIGTIPPGSFPPVGAVPPIGTIPPGSMPPIGVKPPIGTIPPGSMPPAGAVPPIGTIPPETFPPIGVKPPIGTVPSPYAAEIDLVKQMQTALTNNNVFTRLGIVSFADKMEDMDVVFSNALQTPAQIANVVGQYFGADNAAKIQDAFTSQTKAALDLTAAMRDGKTAEANRLINLMHAGADKIKTTFSGMSSYIDSSELGNLLHSQTDAIISQVTNRMKGSFVTDLDAFIKSETYAARIADVLVQGIVRQFPSKFR